MRGVFTAGVLDVFAERGEPPYDVIIGVSAGACCAASFLARQHPRNYVVFLEYLTRRQFLDPLRLLNGGSIVDMGYLLGPVTGRFYPLDLGALSSSKCRLEAVATDARSAQPAYLPVEQPDALDALHASCAIPMLYRSAPVTFRGAEFFDGAMSDPVPLDRALKLGATSVTVVLTRPLRWRAKPPSAIVRAVTARWLKPYPSVVKATWVYHNTSNRARRFIDDPPMVPIRIFAPPNDFPVSRLTRRKNTLHRGYIMGRDSALSGGVALGEDNAQRD